MDLSIRDWMIVIGVLMLLAVALDGYRRASRDRKNQVRLARNAKRAQGGFSDIEENYLSELPNGGARVIGIVEGPDIDPTNPPDIVSERIIFQAKPDPRVEQMLNPVGERQEPTIDEEINPTENEPHAVDDVLFAPSRSRKAKNRNKHKPKGYIQPSLFEEEKPGKTKDHEFEIIALNVLAKNSEGFAGEDLLHILLACDCRFGEMNIFHRYESENAKGEIQFSIVNIVEPGIFKLDDIANFTTPGVSFFLRLPGPKDPMEAFNCMVETAQCLVRNLNGELKDERRSSVTHQTLEHTREQIRDFLKRQLGGA
jgi:cell division protein ZipA